MTAADALEQRLLDGYAGQLAQYERALAILGQSEADASDTSNWVKDLHAVLLTLTALDAAMAPDKAAWRTAGREADGDLGAVWERIGACINALAAGVHTRMAAVETRKKGLLPALDTLIQKRRMHEAYGKHGGIAPHGAASM